MIECPELRIMISYQKSARGKQSTHVNLLRGSLFEIFEVSGDIDTHLKQGKTVEEFTNKVGEYNQVWDGLNFPGFNVFHNDETGKLVGYLQGAEVFLAHMRQMLQKEIKNKITKEQSIYYLGEDGVEIKLSDLHVFRGRNTGFTYKDKNGNLEWSEVYGK